MSQDDNEKRRIENEHGAQESSFRVVDKRRFTAEGNEKSGESNSRGAQPQARSSQENPKLGEAKKPVDRQSAREANDVQFSSFVMGLATQSMALLGEIPDPSSGERVLHLEGAKEMIDILGMLEVKTKGNLTPDETRLIDEVLAGLRLAYVKRAGAQRTGQ